MHCRNAIVLALKSTSRVEFKLVYGPGARHVDDSITINRISIARMALIVSFYLNSNINALANIL